MILLDKNSYSLLAYLLKLEEAETVMAISKAIKQSRRKIYYHLEKINDALPSDVPPIVGIPRVGIVLTASQKKACRHLLAEIDDYSYIMSIEERMQLSIACIAISEERITIEKLMQVNDVSRNTVLNDLHEIRRSLALEKYSVQLGVSKVRGYYLDCHPLSKIQYLYHLFHQIYFEGTDNFRGLLEEKIAEVTGIAKHFPPNLVLYLEKDIQAIEKNLGKKINHQDAQFMVKILPYLLMSYRNIPLTADERENISRDFILAQERKEYVIAEQVAQQLQDRFGLNLDEIEMSIIAMLLLSYRKDSDSHVFSQDYDELRNSLETFIAHLESAHGLSFAHPTDLITQLTVHCKALLFRKTYDILSLNPLTNQIKEQYGELFRAVKASAFILEDSWAVSLLDDDLAYIAIHIGGDLVRGKAATATLPKLVLVCDDGVGLQKLLFSQCRYYLPDCQIEAIFTTEQFYSVADILEADLLISTSDSLETDLPAILVSPVLTDRDIIRLIRFVRRKGQGVDRFDQNLEQAIRIYVKDDTEAYRLKSKVEKLINRDLLADFYLTTEKKDGYDREDWDS